MMISLKLSEFATTEKMTRESSDSSVRNMWYCEDKYICNTRHNFLNFDEGFVPHQFPHLPIKENKSKLRDYLNQFILDKLKNLKFDRRNLLVITLIVFYKHRR